MNSQFTDEEKRFLLAEMIKSSRLDVETLGNFIRVNSIEPNWMHMQLPLGRNMNQCMQAADNIGIGQRSWPKRKASGDQGEPTAKRMALMGSLEPPVVAAAPPTASTLVAILPRPASSTSEMTSVVPNAPPPSTAPKKKGRPARADKARFRPILPQHIAPRPVEQNQRNPSPTQSGQQPQQSQQPQQPRGHSIPRTIPPPGSHNQDSSVNLPAANNYRTSYPSPTRGRMDLPRGETAQDEAAQPRVLAEPAYDQPENHRPSLRPGPIPLEPDPRANSSVAGGLNHELTTLPPLLERDSKVGLMRSPRVETQAPVANSA